MLDGTDHRLGALTDSPDTHPYACGFPTDTYPGQQSTDPYDDHCGNGVHGNGHAITGNDSAVTSRAVDQGYVGELIDDLVSRYGAASAGGVRLFELDNEPMLWNSTHRDVHPKPVTYDELWQKTKTYGAAMKAKDPTAKILGPSDWGWCAYFFSAADGCSAGDGPGRARGCAHGRVVPRNAQGIPGRARYQARWTCSMSTTTRRAASRSGMRAAPACSGSGSAPPAPCGIHVHR